jgi:hypothetical protein
MSFCELEFLKKEVEVADPGVRLYDAGERNPTLRREKWGLLMNFV